MQILEHILKNNKAEILAISWQPVGNHCEIGNLLATSWQPLRNWKSVGNQFAISVGIAKLALRNSLNHIHCAFANFAAHIKLQKLSEISHCQIRKPLCQIRKPPCQIRNHFANFANHIAKFATIAKLAIHCEIHKHCEHIAKCLRNFPFSPTVLPSDFVLRITFSSELRFRRFLVPLESLESVESKYGHKEHF